ncbi:TIGR01777 family oxidoreductase [Niallia sp. JL1B1071]|uniref:TIGR01777 family oxidoreductase n=1 Tax=Niallia tiangongensis TaxID=3237105 RepID=UPI0037DCC159
MNFLIAGGTGLVGQALINQLVKDNHTVYCLTRNYSKQNDTPNIHYIPWLNNELPAYPFPSIDIVVNLAGYSLNSGRWTKQRKQVILSSRLQTTTELLAIINRLPTMPSLLLNASAVGIYGTSESMCFNESSPLGDDFLANTVKDWEACAHNAKNYSIRTVFCRFGLVLSNKGGALPKLVLPYRYFLGGRLGTGNQWVSWIHIEDVVEGLLYIANHPTIEGPVNFTSPHPVKMSELGRKISSHLKRPNWFTVPDCLLKIVLGEMSILITKGQHVRPTVLLENGYTFKHTEIGEVIKNLY